MDKVMIGKKLMDLRGKTPRQNVADSLEISISALTMYENGHRTPKDEIKIKIANYYGKSVQDIFFEDKTHNTCSYGKQSV